MRIYSLYDTPPKEGITFTEPTMAQQQFKEEVDINTIMRKYKVTGVLPTVNGFTYGDVSQDIDYRTAMEYLLTAQDEFSALPADVRRRFDNDPAQLLDFLGNDANREEAVTLGLIPKTNLTGDQVVLSAGESPSSAEPSTQTGGTSTV